MRRLGPAVAMAAILAAPSCGADNIAVERQLHALANRLQKATARKDFSGVMSLMTPDFAMKPAKGRWMNRAETEKAMRASWSGVTAITNWGVQIKDLQVKGDTATATVNERLSVDLKDASGVIHPAQAYTVSRETWKRTAAGWKYHRIDEQLSRLGATGVSYVPMRKAVGKPGSTPVRARPKAPTAPAAISPAAARRMLESQYAKFHKAFRARDAVGVMASATPDYYVEYPTRIANRSQVEAELRREIRMTKSVSSWTYDIRRIKIAGSTITALVTERRASTLADDSGKTHSSFVEDTLEDTWVRTSAGWRNRKSRVLSARVKVDGKVRIE